MFEFKKLSLALIVILLSGSLFFSGCTQGSGGGLGGAESILGLGLLAWQLGVFDKKGDDNNAPRILTLTALPNSIIQGGIVLLTVIAVDDDSDTMTYHWTSGDGTIESPTQATTDWQAPDTPGTYSINIEVSDGKKSATAKLDVTVTSI
ncbi:MAG: PKD domain-containing protein [bacterium]